MARPEIPINWKIVDDLLIAGCKGTEVAANVGVYPDTLYRRIQDEKGQDFTAYAAEKRAKGESLLRAQQYAKALGVTKNGDNMMLIWLGKNRLDQSDTRPQDQSVNDKVIGDDLEKAKLKAELAELKRIMSESKTGTIDIPSEQTP